MKASLVASLGALAILSTSTAIARPFTPDDLVNLRRISDPAVSPDGRWAAYTLRETDLAANKGRTDIWLLDLTKKGAKPVAFAADPAASESSPQFSSDGSTLYFLSDKGGGAVWSKPLAGGEARQVTAPAFDISGFKVAPGDARVAIWVDRPLQCNDLACKQPAPAANAGSGRVYDKLFVRHWDTWSDHQRSRLFVLPIANGAAQGNGVLVSKGLEGDVPSKPFGGGEEISWSPDGATLYFALREAGRIEARSTNLDIFSAPADGSAAPTNLTRANQATDNWPIVSPDGRYLAWAAMKRPTYESDRMVLQVRDLKTGETRALTEGWDRSVASIAWAPNSRSLYVTALDHLDEPLFQVDLADGKVRRMTGEGSVAATAPSGNGIVYTLNSLTEPGDLYRLDERGAPTRLTAVNADKLAGVDMPQPTRFSFVGANGDMVWGFALKPPALANGAKAPIAFLVHGGPQGSFGNGWSYRWNPAVFTGAGYGAVMIDFHGSVGYGQAFTDSINRDWGGKPLQDLKLGLAAATEKFPWLNANDACALGASYGGFMMNWIAGNWPDRFRCIVNHDGVFDARGMAYETEELWFDEWEHGGPYYEHPEEYEKWNPVNHVTAWKTPMLIIHGEKDYRIPVTQGLGAFTVLQQRGIPSRLLVFPDENHWVLKPRNSLQWHQEVLGWLARWTGK